MALFYLYEHSDNTGRNAYIPSNVFDRGEILSYKNLMSIIGNAMHEMNFEPAQSMVNWNNGILSRS